MFKKKEVKVFTTCMASIVCGVLLANGIKANVTTNTSDNETNVSNFDVKGGIAAPDSNTKYSHRYRYTKIDGIIKDISDVDEIADHYYVFMEDENADKCYTIYMNSGDADICIGSNDKHEKGENVTVFETRSYNKNGVLEYIDFDLQ